MLVIRAGQDMLERKCKPGPAGKEAFIISKRGMHDPVGADPS